MTRAWSEDDDELLAELKVALEAADEAPTSLVEIGNVMPLEPPAVAAEKRIGESREQEALEDFVHVEQERRR